MRSSNTIHNPRWTPEEEALLQNCSGFMPLPDIVRAVRRLNREKHPWERSTSAVKSRLVKLKLSSRTEYDNHSLSEIARLLDISTSRVRRWVLFKGLTRRHAGRRSVISIRTLRKWARQNLDQLFGIEYERLVWLLDSTKLAKQCQEIKPYRAPVAIRRKDTGERFSSMKEAALSLHVDRGTVSHALKRGGNCGGVPIEREVAR